MSNGVKCYTSLRVVLEPELRRLQKECDQIGYIDALSKYLSVTIDDSEKLREIARWKFIDLSSSRDDGFFMLRVWLKTFEFYLKFEKHFYFPHIDPRILDNNMC